MRRLITLLVPACAALALWASSAAAQSGPVLESVVWTKTANAGTAPSVHFHLHFVNPVRESPSKPVRGRIKAQEFGVFLPDGPTIGDFTVPQIAGNSFFDVFFDAPLSQLPPEPQIILPQGIPAPIKRPALGTPAGSPYVPCLPDTMWAGNVDVTWAGLGATGQFVRHYAELPVCPGGLPTYIHVKSTDCPIGAPWTVTGLCPGFGATLVNEDKSPAPNPIPPGWTGFIALTAAAVVAPGTTCCPILKFTCDTRPAEIELCVTACDCGNHNPTIGQIDWHDVPNNMERFHVRFMNPSPTAPTAPVSGQMMSQAFGAYMPDFGPIGRFNVPPIPPQSFFDVFFEVPLDILPPQPQKILPPGVPGAGRSNLLRTMPGSTTGGVPCTRDTIWDGNVDVPIDHYRDQFDHHRGIAEDNGHAHLHL